MPRERVLDSGPMPQSAAPSVLDPKRQRPQRVAVLAGDGIGKDVTAEAVKVLEVAAERWELPLELVHFPYGADHYLETGVSLPAGQMEEFRDRFANPFVAAERGFIDAVIEPHETRLLLRKSMRLLRDKQITRVQRKKGLTPI